ncbi:WYL domain-containing protein, partial [Cellulomonas septica]|nr:WYL domain-containing protein [Cellulomonas septica]
MADAGDATVVAVVVTYHPEPAALRRLLDATARQVDAVVVVDNGSTPETLRAVEDALSRERVLAIEYVTVAGDVSQRRVEPIVLTRTHGRWYLAAWCRSRDDVRWFRLDRVRRADV